MKRVTLYIFFSVTVLTGAVHGFEREPDKTLLWNKFSDLRTIDNYVIGLSANGIAVLELDNSINKLRNVNHLILPSLASTMKVQGEMLVVRLANDNLEIIDISLLPELTLLGEISPSASYADFELINNDLYLSRWFDGVDKYQIQNFSQLEFVTNDMSAVLATQLDHDDSLLYVLDRYNGIVAYSLTGNFGVSIQWLYIPERPFSFRRMFESFIISLNSEGFYFAVFDQPNGSFVRPIYGVPSPVNVLRNNLDLILISPRQIDMMYFPTFSVERTVSFDSCLTGGDTLSINNQKYVILPNERNGITAFNVETEEAPFELLEYPGPVSSLIALDDFLIMGGIRNPIEIYQFNNDSLSSPVLIDGNKTGISDLLLKNNLLYALYSADDNLAVYDLSDIFGFVDKVDSIELTIHHPDKLKSLYLPDAAISLLLALGRDELQVFSDNNGELQSETLWQFDKPIADVAFNNNLLYVTDRFKAVSAYEIGDDFTLNLCNEQNLVGTGWVSLSFDDKLLIFSNTVMTVFDSCLSVDSFVHLVLPVIDAEIFTDTLYTVGSSGIAKYDVSSGTPEFVESGGLGGSQIATGNVFTAASDGSSVEIYLMGAPESENSHHQSGPNKLALYDNYPDPFNSTTVIQFESFAEQHVTLAIYNLLGQRIKVLMDARVTTGLYNVHWDGRDYRGDAAATGIYFYRLESEDESLASKLVLIR